MKILIASQVFPEAVERLRERHDVICAFSADSEKLKALIFDREGLVFRSGVTIDAALHLLMKGPHPAKMDHRKRQIWGEVKKKIQTINGDWKCDQIVTKPGIIPDY